MSATSTVGDTDALFKLPLGEFTTARNSLAAQLKKAGKRVEANVTKALAKPSASAWVVNQLYWRHRESFERLIEAGERLRAAHGAQLIGDSARDLVNARREVIEGLAATAADILREGGQNATRDLMRRVTSTLEALSSYGSLPGAPVAGRLTDDLEPPGFEAVAGLLPDKKGRATGGAQVQMRLPGAELETKPASRANRADLARRDKEERKGLLAAARAAVREAERSSNVARKQAERAAAKLKAAVMRATEVERQRAQIEKQLARLSEDAEAAQARVRESEINAQDAIRTTETSERALELARARLRQLLTSDLAAAEGWYTKSNRSSVR